jgi:hypothetical protein
MTDAMLLDLIPWYIFYCRTLWRYQ